MVGAQRRIGFSLGVGLEGRWENVGVPIHWDSHRANCVNSRWLPPVSHVVNRRAEKSPCDPHSYYNKQRATPSDGRAALPAHSIHFLRHFLRRLPSSSSLFVSGFASSFAFPFPFPRPFIDNAFAPRRHTSRKNGTAAPYRVA